MSSLTDAEVRAQEEALATQQSTAAAPAPTAGHAPESKDDKPLAVRTDHKKHNKILSEENEGLKAKIKELEQRSLPLQNLTTVLEALAKSVSSKK